MYLTYFSSTAASCISNDARHVHTICLKITEWLVSYCKHTLFKPFAFESSLYVTHRIYDSGLNSDGFCFIIYYFWSERWLVQNIVEIKDTVEIKWVISCDITNILAWLALRERCPNTEFSLVCIFLYSNQKKLCIWTLFMQYWCESELAVTWNLSNLKKTWQTMNNEWVPDLVLVKAIWLWANFQLQMTLERTKAMIFRWRKTFMILADTPQAFSFAYYQKRI